MTDNDIKKALEWLERLKRDTDVSEWAESLKIILNEYNRQKAEIERLKGSVIINNIMETQRIKREAKLEVINEFEKEIKYVKENEKYDDFNPIVDIDLCDNVLDTMKLQNEKIKKLNIKNKELSILINTQEKNIKEQQIIIDTLRILNKSVASEAIKEFAKRFAKALSEFDMSSVGLPDYDRGYKDCMTAIEDTIDNIVNKMT